MDKMLSISKVVPLLTCYNGISRKIGYLISDTSYSHNFSYLNLKSVRTPVWGSTMK